MLHIELTRNSDLVVVCPEIANIIAKFANVFANDLASTALIAFNKQILFMPAMNVEMWNNRINKKNNAFGSKYNKVTFITNNKIEKLPKMTKIDIAKELINKILHNFYHV